MPCLEPVTFVQKKTKKVLTIPCGKCLECLNAKRADWFFRLRQEYLSSISAFFVTLTYNDEEVDKVFGNLSKRDVQLFLKKLRNDIAKANKSSVSYDRLVSNTIRPPREKVSQIASKGQKTAYPNFRYYLIGEYGPQTYRPHYHGLFFNVPGDMMSVLSMIILAWNKGFVTVTCITDARINYCAKHQFARYEDNIPGLEKPFALMSTKPGIGNSYLTDKVKRFHKKSLSSEVRLDSMAVRMPRYYKEKVFNKLEREKVRENIIKKLDLKYFKDHEILRDMGNDPFIYELENKVSRNKYLKKRLTKKPKNGSI